jgi:hypothetical protein
MLRSARLLALLAVACLAAACVAQRSFVDPGGPSLQAGDLVRPAQPLHLTVRATMLVDGLHEEDGDDLLRERVERVLLASGVIEPVLEHAEGEIQVFLNDAGDRTASAAKGFGTGLSFGAAGSSIEDNYEMTVTITQAGRTFRSAGLRQVIHTLLGQAPAPPGAEMLETSAAVERVIRQLLLEALVQFQRSKRPGATGSTAPHA